MQPGVRLRGDLLVAHEKRSLSYNEEDARSPHPDRLKPRGNHTGA